MIHCFEISLAKRSLIAPRPIRHLRKRSKAPWLGSSDRIYPVLRCRPAQHAAARIAQAVGGRADHSCARPSTPGLCVDAIGMSRR